MSNRTEYDYRKTEAVSHRGMAAAMHPLAAEAGAEILDRGGNAIAATVTIDGTVPLPRAAALPLVPGETTA